MAADVVKTVSMPVRVEGDFGGATVIGVSATDHGDDYKTVTVEGLYGTGIHFELTCAVDVLKRKQGWMGDALRAGWELVRGELERG